MAGNIDAGKTSTTERLGARLNWRVVFEPLIGNSNLPDFYDAMRALPFYLQALPPGRRAEQ